VQSIRNWNDGKGFQLHDAPKPFAPENTVGLPMAWGVSFSHSLTGYDWPQAGRVWVQFNFYLLLVLVAFYSRYRSKSWGASLVAMACFGFLISQVPAGPYVVYGILGEIPGALIAWSALLALDSSLAPLAGVLAVLTYMTKPSYILFIPTVVMIAFLYNRRKGIYAGVLAMITGILFILAIASARGESILEYASVYFHTASRLSLQSSANLFSYYRDAGWVMIFSTLAILFIGGAGILSRWRPKKGFDRFPFTPAESAAWLFFVLGCLMYGILGRRPVTKHWFVFYNLAAAALSIRIGLWIGPWLSRKLGDNILQVALWGVVFTWVINVPPLQKQRFNQTDASACGVKEQRVLDRLLVELSQKGELNRKNLISVIDASYSMFIYELGWNPDYYFSWNEVPRPIPRWVAGDIATLNQSKPQVCSWRWRGGALGLLDCGSSSPLATK
jgi:hypothetical protein